MSDTSTPILIVDDHSPTRKLIRLGLQRLGYRQCFEAADGHEALELMPDNQIGLVLTDLEMEGMDGLALLMHIRGKYAELPVVILTSHHEAEFRHSAEELGASDFLSKPLNLAELKTVMARILG